MPGMRKGSPAAKAWGRKMHAARGGRKKKGVKKAAPKKKVLRGKGVGRVTIGGIAYEPKGARTRRAAPKRKKKGRAKANQLPYGYGSY